LRHNAGVIVELQKSVADLVAAVTKASSSLTTSGAAMEDMPLVVEQAGRAVASVDELASLLKTKSDERFVILHRINNQLTGILSLSLLVRDDLPAGHPSREALDCVDRVGRDAAAAVKKVSASLKTTS
jgi:hypothetical protein